MTRLRARRRRRALRGTGMSLEWTGSLFSAISEAVISTNLLTGVSWVNRHGKTGYVVFLGNAEELSKGIQHLFSNPQLREEMASCIPVERHVASTKMVAGMLQVDQGMLNEPCRTGVSVSVRIGRM